MQTYLYPDAPVAVVERPSPHRLPAAVLRLHNIDPIAIFCGAEIPITPSDICEVDYGRRSWSVQMLPEEPNPSLGTSAKAPVTRRSNGCGARVHSLVRLTWHEKEQCWYGGTEGVAATVLHLETRYFSPAVAEFLGLRNGDAGKAHCGCAISGVGCAVCGNPLGTLRNFCITHAPLDVSTARRDAYLFIFSAVSLAPKPTEKVRGGPSLLQWRCPGFSACAVFIMSLTVAHTQSVFSQVSPLPAPVSYKLHTAIHTPYPVCNSVARPPKRGAAFRDERGGGDWDDVG
ncbi:hypothetical protein B0H14DRAFT_2674619 [Mycena olivaceomarginata]|nr:hypothetical protein B0H14DRAFT_2674619 [Mycena olivaceomarginata]